MRCYHAELLSFVSVVCGIFESSMIAKDVVLSAGVAGTRSSKLGAHDSGNHAHGADNARPN